MAAHVAALYADDVLKKMRTTFRKVEQGDRFRQAFEDVVPEKFADDLRVEIKREIGSILGSRPKRKRGAPRVVTPVKSTHPPKLKIISQNEGEVVLAGMQMGDLLVYRRFADGRVVNVLTIGSFSREFIDTVLAQALELFRKMDAEAESHKAKVQILVATDKHIALRLNDKLRAIASRGVSGGVRLAIVDIHNRVVLQKNAPPLLVDEARIIAKKHFSDTRVSDLFEY